MQGEYLRLNDKYSAALYIRLSKEDDNEGPSESVNNQKSLLFEYVRKHELSVYDTYIDDGFSGTDFDRPAFSKMIEAIESKRVNMVITKDLSRLGRDYIMTGYYMERFFPEKKVRFISLLDGIDTGVESTANDITPFRAIMNDMYAKDISKKIKSVKRDKQRKGEFIGGKALYGYKMHPTEKNKIVIDEEAAKVVRCIFRLARSGMSCRQIAMRLNEEGILTPAKYAGLAVSDKSIYSGKWSSERISDMLQNETYIGNMVQGRRVKVNYKSKKCIKNARENWIVVENTHEAIIDKDTFQKVKMLIESRRHIRSRKYDFLLKGLIYCHECGYPLAVINRKNKKGEDTLYFVCRTYQRFAKDGACKGHILREKLVTDAVIEKVRKVCFQYFKEENFITLAEKMIEKAEEADKTKVILQSYQEKMESLNKKFDKIYLDKINGILTDYDYRRIAEKIISEREKTEIKIAELNKVLQSPVDKEEKARILTRKFLCTAFLQRGFLMRMIERVELTQDKEILIRFRFKKSLQ